MLALAEEGFAVFFGFKFLRGEIGAFVAAVAEWLINGLTAGAEEVSFAFFKFDADGLFCCYFRFTHGWNLSAIGSLVIQQNFQSSRNNHD